MAIEVRFHAQARDDLRNLGSGALKLEAAKFLLVLERAPLFGEQLGEHAETGDLSDCRKIYFDKARHRIVYRVLPNEKRPKSVEVIVIGARAELEVYTEAIRRLGRLVDEE
jgi:mRNA-degrading endonuclease RelE of RelBE toxin-antitoxin system